MDTDSGVVPAEPMSTAKVAREAACCIPNLRRVMDRTSTLARKCGDAVVEPTEAKGTPATGRSGALPPWLAEHATVRGLIRPREVPRLWDRHILNCAALADVVPEGPASPTWVPALLAWYPARHRRPDGRAR